MKKKSQTSHVHVCRQISKRNINRISRIWNAWQKKFASCMHQLPRPNRAQKKKKKSFASKMHQLRLPLLARLRQTDLSHVVPSSHFHASTDAFPNFSYKKKNYVSILSRNTLADISKSCARCKEWNHGPHGHSTKIRLSFPFLRRLELSDLTDPTNQINENSKNYTSQRHISTFQPQIISPFFPFFSFLPYSFTAFIRVTFIASIPRSHIH